MLDRIFSYDTLWWVLMAIYIPACLGLVVIVLLQKGKGAGFAGAFGAGAGPGADTVFGPRMSQSLPIRLTYAAATLFMLIAVIMSLIAGKVGKGVAPELVEDTGTAQVATSSSALSDLGLGTNKVDEDRVGEELPLTGSLDEAQESPGIVEEEPAGTAEPETATAGEEKVSEVTEDASAAEAAPSEPAEETPVSQ